MWPKRIAKPLDIYIRTSDVRGRSGRVVHLSMRPGGALPRSRPSAWLRDRLGVRGLDASSGSPAEGRFGRLKRDDSPHKCRDHLTTR